jgi:hypothetical protein
VSKLIPGFKSSVAEGWARDHNGIWHRVTTRNHPDTGIWRMECSGGVLVRTLMPSAKPPNEWCALCKKVITRRVVEE